MVLLARKTGIFITYEIRFHGAWTEEIHRDRQGQILVLWHGHVAHHFDLGIHRVENVLGFKRLVEASADAFSSNLLIMSLIKPLTFAKESSPLEISACIAKSTRDASCANSSDRLLLVWTSKSAAFVWIARQSCIVSSNAAVSAARATSVIFKSAVSVTNWSSSSSRMCWSWICRVIRNTGLPNLSSDSRASRPGIRSTRVSSPSSLGGLSAITERESARVLASVLDCWDRTSSLFSWTTVPCAARAFVSNATAIAVAALATVE